MIRSRPVIARIRWTASMVASVPELPNRLDDRGVRVPGQPHAVAAVQVHVLVAVDVIDLGTEAVAKPDRLWRGDLPARRHPAGQRPGRQGGRLPRPWLAFGEDSLLLGDDLGEVGWQSHGAVLRAGHGGPLLFD